MIDPRRARKSSSVRRPSLSVFSLTDREVDVAAEAALLAFVGGLGEPALYWSHIRSALDDPPALFVLAATEWPLVRPQPSAIGGLIVATPADGVSARLSPIWTLPSYSSDVGMMAALYKTVLERLQEERVPLVTYLTPEFDEYQAQLLERHGFTLGGLGPMPEHGDERMRTHEAAISSLAAALALNELSVDHLLGPRFGRRPADAIVGAYVAQLQLGGHGRRFGTLGNPVGSEPGTPAPDGGTGPSPSGPPDGGTVGSEPGTP